MKRNSYSLGSLMLLTLNAAIGLTSIRLAIMLIWSNPTKSQASDAVMLMIAGGLVGGLVTVCLSAWGHSTWWHLGLAWIGGVCLGTAAGAQFTVAVNWWWLIVVPIGLVAASYLVALNRRAKLDRLEENPVSATPASAAVAADASSSADAGDNSYAPISRS